MTGEPQKVRLKLSPQAQRYARPDAPRDARLMAARGALPLPPIELATVLFALLHDPDAEVKSTARESLEQLPDGVAGTVLSGPAHPALLAHLAHAFRDDETRTERIALNAATPDATVAFLATLPFRRVVDIVSNNQQRMLRCPEIVDALGANPLTGRAVTERILSFLGMAAEDSSDELARDIGQDEAEAALRAVLGDELGAFARELIEDRDDAEITDANESSLYALIQKMSVFQKIKLARLGNKEARGLLVRDRNKIVAVAAITSPKVTENEVASIASSRNISDEVLRMVAMNRLWTRSYKVKLNLVTNPKCPQAMSLKFLNFLQDKDLKSIMRSKDVNAVVSTQARRTLMKKGKL
jgi:hypothetical protein